MIIIKQSASSNAVFTLTEKCLLPSPYFLFQLINDLDNSNTLFYANDISTNVERFNEFIFIEATNTEIAEDLNNGTFKLNRGMYTYNVYESDTNLDFELFGKNVIETGKLEIIAPYSNEEYIVDDNYTAFGVDEPSFNMADYRKIHFESNTLDVSDSVGLGGTVSIELNEVGSGYVGNVNKTHYIEWDEYGRVRYSEEYDIEFPDAPPSSFNNELGKGLTGSTIVESGNTQSLSTIYNTDIDDSLTVPVTVGGITSGTTFGSLKSKSIVEVLDDILYPTIPPVYTQPLLYTNISWSGLGQCGVTFSTLLNMAFERNDAGTASSYSITDSGVTIATASAYVGSYVIHDNRPTLHTFTYSCFYNEGIIKNDNKGNPYPTGHILSGVIRGGRTLKTIFPYLHGRYGNTDVYDEALISAGTKVIAESNVNLSIPFNATNQFVFFAIPVSDAAQATQTYTKWYETELNQGSIGGDDNLFGTPQLMTLTVNGIAKDYTVYTTNYMSTFNTLQIKIS